MHDLDLSRERKEVAERSCKGVRGINSPKRTSTFPWEVLKGRKKRKRPGKWKSRSSSRLSCVCAGPSGAKTPSGDNATETMEDAENRGPAQLLGHLSRLIRLLRIPEMSL